MAATVIQYIHCPSRASMWPQVLGQAIGLPLFMALFAFLGERLLEACKTTWGPCLHACKLMSCSLQACCHGCCEVQQAAAQTKAHDMRCDKHAYVTSIKLFGKL